MKRNSSHVPGETPVTTPRAAAFTFSPERSAAQVIHGFAGLDPKRLTRILETQGQAVAQGDLEGVCRSLTAQVTTLERMFHHFFELATEHPSGSEPHERLMRLSLRAQLQSARTAAVLGHLSPPPPAPQGAPPVKAAAAATELDAATVQDPESGAWLPATCGSDCASHVALVRLTRWAARSSAARGSLTRIMNAEGVAANGGTQAASATGA